MKRIILFCFLLSFLLLACMPATFSAFAEEAEYLEIDREEVYLYENTRRAAPMFMIPRTFYVRIVEANYTEDEHLVEYNGVQGLLKISSVSGKVLKNVENPYYTSQKISAHVDTLLYLSPNFNAKTDIAASDLSLLYLGKTQGDQGKYGTSIWFAVLYTDKVYYIHSAQTTNLNLLESSFAPVHPNSVTQATVVEEQGGGDEDQAEPESSFDTVRLLLILGMIVPVVIILFLLFRPKRRAKRVTHSNERDRRYYRDEDDYDDY